MSAEPQLFRINPGSNESERIEEVDFARLGFQERRDIQEWVAANPAILGDDLLIIEKEFSGFDRTNERLDLLAVDTDGKLVVIELKRDDTGSDAHWQAIKYASYLGRASTEQIVAMLANIAGVSDSEAANRLLQHLNSDDLDALNNDQRIILASHRFAPEVTSAALWLNEQVGKDLMTCIRLTPHQDGDALYVQANPIIPVPGIEDYVIGIGNSANVNGPVVRGRSKLKQTFDRNRGDDVTRFARRVAELATRELLEEVKPDRTSRWAGGSEDWRYYHLWYRRDPWQNWDMSHKIHFSRDAEHRSSWAAKVHFGFRKNSDFTNLSASEVADLKHRLEGIHIVEGQTLAEWTQGVELIVPHDPNSLDDAFAVTLAGTLRKFIEVVTPVVDEFEAARNEEDA